MSFKTFQIILESEMDKARDQKGVTGHEFTKQAHFDRPSSSASNKAVDVSTFSPVTLQFFYPPSSGFASCVGTVGMVSCHPTLDVALLYSRAVSDLGLDRIG